MTATLRHDHNAMALPGESKPVRVEPLRLPEPLEQPPAEPNRREALPEEQPAQPVEEPTPA
jgi:hypothetical protein